MNELDLVVLTRDIEEFKLKSGDIGTIVHNYKDKAGFEVEFSTAGGKTISVLTLTASDIRPFSADEILHSRDMSNLAA